MTPDRPTSGLLFLLALFGTFVCLLAPASAIVDFNNWVASWLPLAAILHAADASSHVDKLVHAALFSTLGFLAARAWMAARQRRLMALVLLIVGFVTEVLQRLVPGRSASLADWSFDALGVLLGMACAMCIPDQISLSERTHS